MRLRRALGTEASALAELAVRSKGHWPYPPEFLARFAATLGMSAEVVATNEVWVATRGGELRGFVTLLHRADRTILDDLWLEPDEIGRGTGRLLFDHARTRAAAAGARTLEWEAEPYAAGFYERMGGVVVGMVDSPLGRPLPLMRIPVGASWAPC